MEPDSGMARWNRGNVYLLQGKLEQGFIDHEGRLTAENHKKAALPQHLRWQGETDLKGKTLFIYSDLYLGDMLQFCRYALLAERKGANVIVAVTDKLHAILRTLSKNIQFIPKDDIPKHFDYFCDLLSLPFCFKTKFDTIPADVPYLTADPERTLRWGERIGKDGFKIGICWQGSTQAYAVPMRRSFPLLHFSKIAALPKVRLISLQKNEGVEQLLDLPDSMKVETLGDDFDAGPGAFLDTAAVMENLDLVITPDTSIAHLAGALGRPTWVVLRDIPDWRWLLDREDSPWYPNTRLFRQNKRDEWQVPFDEMEKRLKAMLS